MQRARVSFAVVAILVSIGAVAVHLGSQPRPAQRAYVGQESCMAANCHEGAYGEASSYQGAAKFRETIHQKIHLRPTPRTVIIDKYFEGDSVVRFKPLPDSVAPHDIIEIAFSKSADRKEYFIQLRFSGGGDSTPKMKVAYTYGGNGWIERFLLEVNGAWYVAPFQYILPGYKNRSSVGGKFYFIDGGKRWYSVDRTTGEATFLEFNSNRFRSRSWDNECAACHVNGFDVKLTVDGPDSIWNALWVGVREKDSALQDQNIKVGCESCHGPGSEHVANPTADNIVSPSRFPETMAGTDLKYDLCGQCHNRDSSTKALHTYPFDDSLGMPYMPGTPLRPFIQDPFSAMEIWWPDITSNAHHQQGQDIVSSRHYTKNIFKNGCWSCHTPHQNGPDGLPYQLDRNWYSLKKGEGCLNNACHPTMADTGFSPVVGRSVNLHTQHSQEVSQCVNCHFTRIISIAFDSLPTRPYYDFSDHTFRVIRPSLTRKYAGRAINGMPSTCALSCHRNGRGQRNFDPSTPIATSFGTNDTSWFRWKDNADFDLADSLWFHYKQMYAKYLGAVKESEAAAGMTAITSATPNPMRTATVIRYTIGRATEAELAIYDLGGRFVRTVSAGRQEAGAYSATWDGADDFGNSVVSGLYMVRLTTRGRAPVSVKLMVQR